ncbi:MAG: mucoidy inhibitor MuiA family protein [bacterium]
MSLIVTLLFGITLSSKIDTVIVYSNQVRILRIAQVNLTGTEELVLPNLPGALDANSVRVRAPGLRIGEVQVKPVYLAEPNLEIKVLEKKVKALEDSLKMLEDEAAVLKAQEEFLNSVKLGAPEIIARELREGKVAPESWRGALNFVAAGLSKVKMRSIALAREHEEVKKRLDAAKQELADTRALTENRKELRFVAEGEPGSYRITVIYVLPRAANWQPYYELRAKPGSEVVDASYFARLNQRTGEDWDDVKLILSTATPVRELQPPQPVPWFLWLIEETPRAKTFTDYEGAMVPGIQEEEAVRRSAPAPGGEEIPTTETGVAIQFLIPGRVSLKSGAPSKKLPLKQFTLPARFEYYTLPLRDEKVFLTAQLSNTTDLILLSGEASTYVNEEYTGQTSIPTIAPQESLTTGFGIDERIKVKRELVKTFKTRTGLLNKTERVQFVYRTTVENYHPKPIKIKIVEQLPVSQQKEIKVNLTQVAPKPTEQDNDQGTLTYIIDITSGKKFEINLEYNVEYPAGKQVGGLY